MQLLDVVDAADGQVRLGGHGVAPQVEFEIAKLKQNLKQFLTYF